MQELPKDVIGDVLVRFDWDARIEELRTSPPELGRTPTGNSDLRGTPTPEKAGDNTLLQVEGILGVCRGFVGCILGVCWGYVVTRVRGNPIGVSNLHASVCDMRVSVSNPDSCVSNTDPCVSNTNSCV